MESCRRECCWWDHRELVKPFWLGLWLERPVFHSSTPLDQNSTKFWSARVHAVSETCSVSTSGSISFETSTIANSIYFVEAAKERAPCVIFIDEIDSVGAKRTNSVLHPYANQTINQLLSEMDGFQQNEGVIVLGATNRREDLDQALMRPGRFDVEVMVPTPDFTGRKEIITHYLGKVLSKDINVDMLARGTTGFTGADIENMINQAALRAAIEGAEVVAMRHVENARDKVLMGPERKARLPDEEANKITAYHEGGHAIVAYYTKVSAFTQSQDKILQKCIFRSHIHFTKSRLCLEVNRSVTLLTSQRENATTSPKHNF